MEDSQFPISKPTYFTEALIETMQCWHEDTCVNRWNRIKSKNKPIGYGQMVFSMATKTILWRRNSLTNDAGCLDLSG